MHLTYRKSNEHGSGDRPTLPEISAAADALMGEFVITPSAAQHVAKVVLESAASVRRKENCGETTVDQP
jgi:hypothetical protein